MEVSGQQQTPVTAVPTTESPVRVAEHAAWKIWRRKSLVLLPGIQAQIVEPTAWDYRLRYCGSPFWSIGVFFTQYNARRERNTMWVSHKEILWEWGLVSVGSSWLWCFIYLLTAIGFTSSDRSTCTYSHTHKKKYTEQNNDTEYPERNIYNNKNT